MSIHCTYRYKHMYRFFLTTKRLICGTEGEIVVGHGRLPSPTRPRRLFLSMQLCYFVSQLSQARHFSITNYAYHRLAQ